MTLSASFKMYEDFSAKMEKAAAAADTMAGRAENLKSVVEQDLTPNIDLAKLEAAQNKLDAYSSMMNIQADEIQSLNNQLDQQASVLGSTESALSAATAELQKWQSVLDSTNPLPEQWAQATDNVERLQNKINLLSYNKAGGAVNKLSKDLGKAEIDQAKFAEKAAKSAEALSKLTNTKADQALDQIMKDALDRTIAEKQRFYTLYDDAGKSAYKISKACAQT